MIEDMYEKILNTIFFNSKSELLQWIIEIERKLELDFHLELHHLNRINSNCAMLNFRANYSSNASISLTNINTSNRKSTFFKLISSEF